MSSEFFLLAGLAVLVAVFAAAYLAMLAFHNPLRPAWMNRGYADNAVVILLVTVAVFDFAWILETLTGLGIDPLAAIVMETAAAIFVATMLWRKFHMRERLEATRNGMSPFSELRHIRSRSRGGRHTTDFGGGKVGAA